MSHTPILNPYTPFKSEHISTDSRKKAQDSWAEKAGQCIVIPHLAEPTPIAPSVVPKRTSQLGARCVSLPGHAVEIHVPDSLAIECGHVPMFQPTDYEQKRCVLLMGLAH